MAAPTTSHGYSVMDAHFDLQGPSRHQPPPAAAAPHPKSTSSRPNMHAYRTMLLQRALEHSDDSDDVSSLPFSPPTHHVMNTGLIPALFSWTEIACLLVSP